MLLLKYVSKGLIEWKFIENRIFIFLKCIKVLRLFKFQKLNGRDCVLFFRGKILETHIIIKSIHEVEFIYISKKLCAIHLIIWRNYIFIIFFNKLWQIHVILLSNWQTVRVGVHRKKIFPFSLFTMIFSWK